MSESGNENLRVSPKLRTFRAISTHFAPFRIQNNILNPKSRALGAQSIENRPFQQELFAPFDFRALCIYCILYNVYMQYINH